MNVKEKLFWINIIKRNKGFLLLQLCLLFCSSGFGIFGAYLYMKIVDALTKLDFKTGALLCILYVVINMIALVISFGVSWVSKTTSNRVDIYIKKKLFDNIISQNGKKILITDSSEYTTLLLNDSSKVSEVINGLVMPSLLSLFRAIGLIVFLMIVEWRLLVVALVIQPIVMILQKKAKQSLEENADIGRESMLSFIATIKEYTSHLFEIVMLKKHDYFCNSFQNKLVRQKKYEKKIAMLEAKNDVIIEFFIMISIVVIIAYGGYEVCKERITIGVLMLYIQYYSGLLTPFGDILQNVFEYTSVRPSLNKIIEFLHVEDVDSGKKMNETFITCKGVDFSYDEKEVLKNVNLKLNLGNSYGIFGESGSGKSTFAKLLVGFLEPTNGNIMYGTVDSKVVDKNELINQVCYVSQEGYLLNDTIYNNIVLDQECDKNTFEQILRKVNLFHFVNELPNKENTIVGDNGALISGGQKKRIILARAILNKAPIVILDEPTTGLDEKNAREVVSNLMDDFSNSLVVVISHQMNIIELCNTKFCLYDKKIEQV